MRIDTPDTLTFGGDPGEIDRLNDTLERLEDVRPLGRPVRAGSRLLVPTTMDASTVLGMLGKAGVEHTGQADPELFSGTLKLAGKSIGHGFSFAEVSLDEQPDVPWTKPPAGLRRPVVALLDSGVHGEHRWLPHDTDDPFLIDAERHSTPWQPKMTDDGAAVAHPRLEPGEVPHEGHATFIAGLIRQAAPSARVLSIRLMNNKGRVSEGRVVSALHWILEDYLDEDHPVDLICMAFGREGGDTAGSAPLEAMGEPLAALAALGVQLVASAGNDHQDGEIYPAAFPAVTAVGAGFGGYHASFSNYGDWVGRYRDGVDALSIMPGDKWARWSGTSFAAATFAGDLARPRVAAPHV